MSDVSDDVAEWGAYAAMTRWSAVDAEMEFFVDDVRSAIELHASAAAHDASAEAKFAQVVATRQEYMDAVLAGDNDAQRAALPAVAEAILDVQDELHRAASDRLMLAYKVFDAVPDGNADATNAAGLALADASTQAALCWLNWYETGSGHLAHRLATHSKLQMIWDASRYPDYGEFSPDSLKAMVDEHKARVLVRVFCADHKTLMAAVFRTPSKKLLLVSQWVNLDPNRQASLVKRRAIARKMWGEPFAAILDRTEDREGWIPKPSSLGEEPQPKIWCLRCGTSRPVGDLLAAATLASKTRRADLHA